ncbi:CBS domain-containing protein [Haliangium sp.]|uniref:CBS domain-containing protein n=1 Tax=Haliangium sp. TaxID=2663208 RepID=UPI003D0FB991
MPNFAMPVSLFMSAPVETISPDATLEDARARLKALAISSLAVTDPENALVGVISRSDLLRVGRWQAGMRRGAALLTLPAQPVSEVMTRDVVTVTAEDTVAAAGRLMARRNIHRVIVADGPRPVGVLSTKDVMRAIEDKRMNNPISEFMSKPIFTIRSTEPVWMATERLEKARVSGVVVVEDDWPVGVFTQRQALAARDLARDTPTEEAMDAAIVCMPEDTRMHRAAAQAAAMRVRRIIACKNRDMVGILSGLDFAKAASD